MSPARPIVTLTTDFGTADSYVGQVKGVLYSSCAGVEIVDISHEIPRHDVAAGARVLNEAAWVYPERTVHVVVVDPGVGGERAVVAMKVGRQFFVGPDNGVLALVRAKADTDEVVRVENPAFRRPFVSHTFHGRDVMAPAAAALARGADIDLLGPRVDHITPLARTVAVPTVVGFAATVTHVDHFGNVVTDLHETQLEGRAVRAAEFEDAAGHAVTLPVVTHYAAAGRGRGAALVGSGGSFEVAVGEGSAAETFGLKAGDAVRFLASTP